MGLSRSAAGKAVTRLEDRLGVRLFNRTTRALSLTDEGRVFYERGQQILAAVDDAEASVMRRPGKPKGVLRLTVPDAFGRLVVLPILKKYIQTWPGIQVEVSFTDRPADIVEEGFDLAVRVSLAVPENTQLVSRVIARYQAVLCAAPAYLAARGEPRTIDDLAAHDCLVFASRNRRHSWRLRGEDGAWTELRAPSRLRMDSAGALRDAAVAGLGITYLPDFLVGPDIATGRLQRVLPDLKNEALSIIVLYPTRRLLEARVRQFIDLMVRELGR
jgi:DNA-binding transcriptional LysR family regulator